jgi:hypothetical protein
LRQQTRRALNLTADHAARALHALITEGKLAIRDVATALSRRRKLMKELKDRFTELETATPAKAGKATAPRVARSRTKAAARAKAGARSTARTAGKTTKKKMVARATTRKKASAPKAAAKAATSKKPARRANVGNRPAAVRVTPRKLAVATTTAKPKRRPATDTASVTPAPTPAPRTEDTLPRVVNPEHEGGAPAPRNWNPI